MDYLQKKAKIIQSIRDYFINTDSLEVFTDIIQYYPNLDSNIYPVELIIYNEKKEPIQAFLHTSPEIQMKKILSKIKKDIFQITKVFRNYEGSYKHKIEFTMLEWYRVGYNLSDLMEDTKNLFIYTAININKKPKINYKGKIFDLTDWEKITVEEAFYRYTSVYLDNIDSMNKFLKEKENFKGSDDWEELFFRIYAFYVEPFLGVDKPTFIYDYPKQLGLLSKVENNKAKRFEAYIDGIELVNGYYEATDYQYVYDILKNDIIKKEKETGIKYKIDDEFLDAIRNLPECSGASLGVDRFIMILLNKDSIHF